jgi:mono/diheme cytochrome c family protein
LTIRNLGALLLLAVAGLLVFWAVTKPHPIAAADVPQHKVDVANGRLLYTAAGCHSCHLASPALQGENAELPSGGTPFKTPIGILYPPNLTPDKETGIGDWSSIEFVNAVQRGIGKSGSHLIPAFPYTSYAKMKVEDVLDIKAYLDTLTPIKNPVPAHNVFALPLVRFGLGGWKFIGLDDAKFEADPTQSVSWNRGAYLVNGPGHCNECHTPRTIFMTSNTSRALQGGPHPEGIGKVPSLVNLLGRTRFKDEADLAAALQFGGTFGYEGLAAGGMGKVQANLAKLPEADVKAIAEYLASLK